MPYKDPEQQREYQRLRVARRRREWLKDNGPCVLCGSWYDLEVDHVDRETKVDHKVWSWSDVRMKTELAKCQVLCSVHHKEKTRREFITVQHGTYAMRNQHGCKCDICLAYVRESKRKWRQSNGRRSQGGSPVLETGMAGIVAPTPDNN